MVRERIEDAITVPLFAIRPMENQYFVMIEQEGVAHMRQIMPGKLNGDRVHVLSGVAAGDRLIVSGHRELREGAAVVVREAGVI
jgi:multidrug efflux pump subunit AcrA (membrane-fusion protein)